MRTVIRYYISVPDANCGEKFWSGERFTCWVDDCKVYVSKSAAQKCFTKLINSGAYMGIALKESRYTI